VLNKCPHVLLGTARGQYKNQVNNIHIKMIWAPPYFCGKYGNRCTCEEKIQCAMELVGNGITLTRYGCNVCNISKGDKSWVWGRPAGHMVLASSIRYPWLGGNSAVAKATKVLLTRMWASAQPDGRPAEHRWRSLFNAAKLGWRPLLDTVQ